MYVADIQLFYQYNRWANLRILRAANRLTPEQLNLAGQFDHGSLLQTLVHIMDAEWSWRLAVIEGQFPGYDIDAADYPTIRKLRQRWTAEMDQMDDYLAGLTDEHLNAPYAYRWERARPRQRTLWHILVHVVNHGTQHRSEAARYLTVLDQSPGGLDFTRFTPRQIL